MRGRLLETSGRSQNKANSLVFFSILILQRCTLVSLNGHVLNKDSIPTGANARFLLDSMFDFAERLNSMHLNDAELALFCAVVLITPGKSTFRYLFHFIPKWHKGLDLMLVLFSPRSTWPSKWGIDRKDEQEIDRGLAYGL